MKCLVFLIFVVCSSGASGAVYKCLGENGQTTYSQQKCGNDAVQVDVQESGHQGTGTNENISDRYESYKKNSRPGEIDREVKRLNSEIKKYQGRMNKELTDLSEKKKYAANNFAGATWEQSISSEMSAVTSKYDALIDSAEAKIDRLLKEKVRIEGSRQFMAPNPTNRPSRSSLCFSLGRVVLCWICEWLRHCFANPAPHQLPLASALCE